MRRIFRAVSIAGCLLVAFSMVSAAQADLVSNFWKAVKLNGGLKDGDTIRVVFVTSAATDALLNDWDVYDLFGDDAATSGIITGGLGLEYYELTDADWRPLVTAKVNHPNGNADPVRDWLTDTELSGLPVFNTKGKLVAESALEMLPENAETLNGSILYDESGDDQTVRSTSVWTGTRADGTAGVYDGIVGVNGIDLRLGSIDYTDDDTGAEFLGHHSVVGNAATLSTSDWLAADTEPHQVTSSFSGEAGPDVPPGMVGSGDGLDSLSASEVTHSIYVMSGAVRVVPEPSTVLLWLGFSGLAGLIYWRKRRG